MKKQSKNVQIALILSVVFIWGLVAYRFRRLATGNETTLASTTFRLPANKTVNASDSLSLLLNYPDPFGRSVDRGVGSSSGISITGGAPKTVADFSKQIIQNTAQPSIQYAGFSKDKDGIHRARLVVNGRSVTLSAGEQHQGIRLLQLSKDSVEVQWNDRVSVIKRH